MLHLLTCAVIAECKTYKCHVHLSSKVIGQAAQQGTWVTRQFATVTDSNDTLSSMLVS